MKSKVLIILSIIVIVASPCLYFGFAKTPDLPSMQKHEHYYLKSTVAPTCTEQGYDLRHCADCFSQYKENFVPALEVGGHDYDGYVCTRCNNLDPNAPMTSPDCLNFAPVYAAGSEVDIVGYEVIGLAEQSLKYVKIPSTYEGKPVIAIGCEAFYNGIGLYYVELPESIVTIRYSAFKYCSRLRGINLPRGLRSIESSAFWDCNSLENIVLNDGLQNIGDSVFVGCDTLRTLVIPSSVENLDMYAAYDCSALEEVYIENGLTEIRTSLFENCKNLKKVRVPNSVKHIDSRAFKNCSNLMTIEYDGTVEQWVKDVKKSCAYYEEDAEDFTWDYGTGDYEVICSDGTIHYFNR